MAKQKRVWTIAMITLAFLIVAGLTVGLVVGLGGKAEEGSRTFGIDHVANTFLMDGEPFRYVSGSFHYFRALPQAWQHRLRTMRAAGLNVVDTYVEWSLHNPYDLKYNWEGIADLEHFLEIARDEGFYVILRPGPYICAERDNGGLPHWLFNKYPNIKVRTNDEDYIKEVRTWYEQLMPRMQRFLYGNGGPIIMVQVENEYGVFDACDHAYTKWLADETEKYVEGKALLFTVDIPNDRMKCGKIEGVFATTDFGYDRIHEIDAIWAMLREIQPTGPLVNSEFYPGWLTHWQEANQRRDAQKVADALDVMLQQGASVNFYMFFGGTNFGFTAGANDWGYGKYQPDITSYDYDAVMDEAGGVTQKFQLVRKVIDKYFDTTGLPSVPEPPKRIAYGPVELHPVARLLSKEALSLLSSRKSIETEYPRTFEELNMYSGLILHETQLPSFEIDPTLLTLNELRDRATVFVDNRLVGTLSRENNIYSLPINQGWGSSLQILVENQGRINFNIANDTKGITGDVTIQTLSGEKQPLRKWNSTALLLDESEVANLIAEYKKGSLPTIAESSNTPVLSHGPTVYYGEFTVSEIGDTYLNPIGWGKGVAYVNGWNLGRYWPLVGPQLTMYVPNQLLKIGSNSLVLIEYQRANRLETSEKTTVSLDDVAQLDGHETRSRRLKNEL